MYEFAKIGEGKRDTFLKGSINDQVMNGGRFNTYLNAKVLYLSYFDKIPNCYKETFVKVKKFNKLLMKRFYADVLNIHYNSRPFKDYGNSKMDDVYYIMSNEVVCYVNYGAEEVEIYFSGKSHTTGEALHELLISCKSPKKVDMPHINIMYQRTSGLGLERLEVRENNLEVDLQYNDDFAAVDQIIKKRLNKKMDKGIILLHGAPGTGKTSYIKHLISHVEKEVIFMPPNVAANLTNPNLMTLLLDYPESILVIEDAENIIIDRDSTGASPVSAILNLSDGILSDCLNMQIICSFNTDLKNVDKALMRKGRLIAKYEFGLLETSKANLLSEKLGFHSNFTEPQLLTDVYNQDEVGQIQPLRKAIGFN